MDIPNSAAATRRLTAMKLSGLTDMESMPHATRNSANSGWSLGAWPHSPTLAPALCASPMTLSDHPLHRVVLLVEQLGKLRGIAVHAEGQLGQVVAADREAVETLGEGLGQDHVRGNLAHDVDLEAIFAAL